MNLTGLRLNSAGIREVMQSQGVAAVAQIPANRAAQAMRASSPDHDIVVEIELHNDRVVAHVVDKTPNSMLIEANTGNMARALDAAKL